MGGSITTTVREMTLADADRVAILAGELGYPSTRAQIEARFRAIEGSNDSKVIVAVDDAGEVVGWVHLFCLPLIVSGTYVEVGGLVVDSRFRGRGIGRALMAAAEAWTLERGFKQLMLRSNTLRTEAHQFYKDLGYTIVKSQHKFQKLLR